MPYTRLAESYYELSPLDALAQKLETTEVPIKELNNEKYLSDVLNRIRKSAIRDIPVFGIHANEYIGLHQRKLLYLIIKMIDILKSLPEYFLSSTKEKYLRHHCTEMNESLKMLNIFYENMLQKK